jgi:Leucine-rich repeat (LRR) protein
MSVTPAAQTTSNRQSSSSSSSSNQGGTQAGMLCAGLGRLRSLSVVNIDTCSYAWLLGLLLGRCPQLTQLVLSMCDRMMGPEGLNPGAQLLDGWDVAASRAADAAAEEGIEATALQLPPIQHLELSGPCHGLLDAWLSLPGAAARLTALHLTGGSAPGLSSHQLQACSSLQELVIESRPSHAEDHLGPDVPRHLVHLTALTKLVLEGCGLTALPGSLWCLTGLRHLNLAHSRVGHTLPSDISALRQLRVLDLTHTWLRELPRPLGAWLPELEDLRIAGTFVWRVPNSLTRLTRLEASCFVRYVSYLQHLVQLKELVIEYSDLRPPLQELSRLTALETLRLEWRDGVSREWTSPVSLQGALPRLRWLSLSKAPLAVLCALGGAGMGHLTQLHLWGLEPTCMGSIQQLGVLPQLQKVYLSTSSSEDSTLSWVAAATWLQQQPKLTNLGFHGGVVEVSVLEQLPPQLEELDLTRVKHPQVQEEQLSALTRLKQLRRLALPLESLTYLPSWLSCLSRLEELSSFCSDVQSGWEVLAALPRLRRLSCSTLGVLLEHAPHLCWVD